MRVPTFLQKYHTCESIVKVPEVDAAHTTLVIQLAVEVECLVGLDLHLADALTRNGTLAGALAAPSAYAAHTALVQGRVELVGPGGAVAVAIAVVVAEQVVAAGLLAAADGEGLIDRREEVFGQVRGERDDGVEVVGRLLGVETAKEVAEERISLRHCAGGRKDDTHRAESKGSTAMVATFLGL